MAGDVETIRVTSPEARDAAEGADRLVIENDGVVIIDERGHTREYKTVEELGRLLANIMLNKGDAERVPPSPRETLLSAQLDDAQKTIKRERRAHRAALAEMAQRHQTELDALRQQLSTDMDTLRADLAAQMSTLQDSLDSLQPPDFNFEVGNTAKARVDNRVEEGWIIESQLWKREGDWYITLSKNDQTLRVKVDEFNRVQTEPVSAPLDETAERQRERAHLETELSALEGIELPALYQRYREHLQEAANTTHRAEFENEAARAAYMNQQRVREVEEHMVALTPEQRNALPPQTREHLIRWVELRDAQEPAIDPAPAVPPARLSGWQRARLSANNAVMYPFVRRVRTVTEYDTAGRPTVVEQRSNGAGAVAAAAILGGLAAYLIWGRHGGPSLEPPPPPSSHGTESIYGSGWDYLAPKGTGVSPDHLQFYNDNVGNHAFAVDLTHAKGLHESGRPGNYTLSGPDGARVKLGWKDNGPLSSDTIKSLKDKFPGIKLRLGHLFYKGRDGTWVKHYVTSIFYK